MPEPAAAAAYREAWDAWLKQVTHLHRVLLEREPIEPAAMKGLLNREARAHDAYEEARRALLGLPPDRPAPPGENPFR